MIRSWSTMLVMEFMMRAMMATGSQLRERCQITMTILATKAMAGCFVIIQFPIEVFEILKGCIRPFVKANLLGKDYSFSISSCC